MSETPLYAPRPYTVRAMWDLIFESPLYRGTSLIRNRRRLGPYSRTMPRARWGSEGCVRFLMSEVPLYRPVTPCGPLLRWARLRRTEPQQGYLAQKKPHPPRSLQ